MSDIKEKGSGARPIRGIKNLNERDEDTYFLNETKIAVAIAKSRFDEVLVNTEMTFPELAVRCSNPKRTPETFKAYTAFPKGRQDKIKDVGGFVAGFRLRGSRKKSGGLYRQAITLDIDFAKLDFWLLFILLYDVAAFIYSTHKHSHENPRFRLVILLDRPVGPDEYEAVSRWVAGVMGIEIFDPTTFEFSRLMYWPSASIDAEFVFHYQEGPALKVDEVLAEYKDWKDSSEWPVSVKVNRAIHNNISKQMDPLEKSGVIGAFCRAYTTHEAIGKFLSKIYVPTEDPNRYTYLKGSTAKGLIIYDDGKFAFSHHGSDPAGGILCNAFDLVRLHGTDEDANLNNED